MSPLLLDSSVWLAWARPDGEPDHDPARRIVERRIARRVELRLLDLTLYELANVVLRGWRRPAADAEGLVDACRTLAGAPPLVPDGGEWRRAAELAEERGLTAYDAAYAAVAAARGLTLVSGDRALVAAGLAVAPGEVRR
ncbi:type II toxin-antitoxin system VapC family toxin [Patulibacter defluvii]|uniref:type II toxin-antitoxin system VapC family toxin n=1 Tax=Patulibacter defluvii TaxID=3095358 RepID=UPI002A76604B|nr:type II toxin-antitoxin system VapC family toxin [Patulibacter sp. DM4]